MGFYQAGYQVTAVRRPTAADSLSQLTTMASAEPYSQFCNYFRPELWQQSCHELLDKIKNKGETNVLSPPSTIVLHCLLREVGTDIAEAPCSAEVGKLHLAYLYMISQMLLNDLTLVKMIFGGGYLELMGSGAFGFGHIPINKLPNRSWKEMDMPWRSILNRSYKEAVDPHCWTLNFSHPIEEGLDIIASLDGSSSEWDLVWFPRFIYVIRDSQETKKSEDAWPVNIPEDQISKTIF